MADNTLLNLGSGGDQIRDKDRSGVKTQIVALDLNPAGSETLMSGGMPIKDSLGNSTNSAGTGFLKVSDEPKQIFYDSFDAAIDTTNMWTSTQGSSGVAAAVALGVLSMGTGTVANGYSKLISIPTFKPVIPGWLVFSDAIAFPDGAAPVSNSYRFWGSGTTPATPTVATPVTDGYGFELYTDGKLRAVVYAGGTRTIIADLSSSGTNVQPLDASYHRWIIQVRTDKTYYFIDSIASSGLVATTNFNSSQAQILPKLFLCIGNSTPPVSNTQIQCSGAVVSDTGKNSTQISDGTYAWRKLQISATGAITANTVGPSKATYRASTTALLVAAVTSPNPWFTIYGSATKTIRIQSIIISGLTLTAVAYLNIGLKKYSTAVSGGTATALTQVPLDANSAAGTATNVNAYTAIPTAGSIVGDITSRRVIGQATTAAAAGIPQIVDFDFSTSEGTPAILRGTAQGIGLYWITAPATAVSMLIKIEWTEE